MLEIPSIAVVAAWHQTRQPVHIYFALKLVASICTVAETTSRQRQSCGVRRSDCFVTLNFPHSTVALHPKPIAGDWTHGKSAAAAGPSSC